MKLVAEPLLQIRARLGEGSIWDTERGLLHWVDIDSFKVHTYDPKTGKNTSIDVGEPVGTVVRRSTANGGGFIVGLPEKFAHVSDNGKITVLCELEKGLGNRMNDGKCDPAGRFFCGSMHFDLKPGAANLWRLDCDRKLTRVLDGVTCSNGLVWTADRSHMYYIDTLTGHLDIFDYDLETGTMTNRRIAVTNTWGGHFDGMTIDSEDNLYIAAWEGGCVYIVDPDGAEGGKLLDKITVPGVKNVTSCAFGGAQLNDLYITSSANKADLNDEPNAGALFKITLTGRQGVPEYQYQG